MKQLSIFAALAVTAMGMAQSNSLVNTTGMSLRLGGVYPLERATRNVTKNMMALGFEFESQSQIVKGGMNYISIDWYGKSGSGAKGNMFPVMYNVRMGDNGTNQFYTFFGVGVVFMDVTSSKTVLGARGGIGTRLSEHLFAEGAAVMSGSANGAKANSVGVFVGYKF